MRTFDSFEIEMEVSPVMIELIYSSAKPVHKA
jgi:hypothetical protein